MSDKIRPYHMPWGLPGAVVLREWSEPIQSGSAEGTRYYIEFKNSKGSTLTMVKRVVWTKHWEGCDYSKINPFLKRS